MNTIFDDFDVPGSAFYFAKLSLTLALRKTHGIVFAMAFLEEYSGEIEQAFRETHGHAGSWQRPH